jgi:hypothetical protein
MDKPAYLIAILISQVGKWKLKITRIGYKTVGFFMQAKCFFYFLFISDTNFRIGYSNKRPLPPPKPPALPLLRRIGNHVDPIWPADIQVRHHVTGNHTA